MKAQTPRRRPLRALVRGFTLMELLVSLTLAAVLLSFGAGAFLSMGKRSAYHQAMAITADMVNKVRNASSRFPAAVVLDPDPTGENGDRIYGRTERVLQELHFEPRPGEGDAVTFANGINGLEVDATMGELVPRGGRVGGGLRLSGSPVECGHWAPYDVLDGLSLDLWINPERLGTAILAEKGDAFNVRLIPSRSGDARIQATLGVDEGGLREERGITVDVPRLAVGEWVGVHVEYDRKTVSISTDHGFGPIERGSVAETRPLKPDPDADLRVGSGFIGVIDDFRFGGVTVEDPIRLPAGAEGVFIVGGPRAIHFRGGKLDPRYHPGVEQIVLRYRTEVVALQIGQSGSIQSVDRVKDGDAIPGVPSDDDAPKEIKDE